MGMRGEWSRVGLCLGLCAFSVLGQGCEWPSLDFPHKRRPSQATPSPTVVPEDPVIQIAERSKENAQLLSEMIAVVNIHPPQDSSDFGNWVDTLNQGASLEGVYNGLTHTIQYQRLELLGHAASPQALRIFGEEIAQLEGELPRPSQLEWVGGLLRATQSGDTPVDAPSSLPVLRDVGKLADQYVTQCVGASLYTLKRLLGDEALKVIASKNKDRERTASWYSKWVVHLALRGVDFGLPLRNKSDEDFHYRWALRSSDDRIKWEVLNRLHRLLNGTSAPPSSP